MDVAIENSHRAEALKVTESPSPVLGSPAPFWIHSPQGDVGEDDDRRRCRKALDVILQPFELLIAKITKTASLEVDYIDKADEVDAVLIETLPTRAFRLLAIFRQVGFAGALVD